VSTPCFLVPYRVERSSRRKYQLLQCNSNIGEQMSGNGSVLADAISHKCAVRQRVTRQHRVEPAYSWKRCCFGPVYLGTSNPSEPGLAIKTRQECVGVAGFTDSLPFACGNRSHAIRRFSGKTHSTTPIDPSHFGCEPANTIQVTADRHLRWLRRDRVTISRSLDTTYEPPSLSSFTSFLH